MKTKRTVLSMIVVLSVFCLSVILSIQSNFNVTQGNHSNDNASLAAESNAMTEESNIAVSPYLLRSFSDEAIKASENEQSLLVDKAEADELVPTEEVPTENVLTEDVLAEDLLTEDVLAEEISDTPMLAKVAAPIETEVFSFASKVPDLVESKYSNIGISIANSYVNIRESASADSDTLGKLYKNSAAEILDTIDEWYYVESGSVKGYVKSEFIKTGIPDNELEEKYGILSVLVKVDGLNVRKEPRTESDKLTVIYRNEAYPVIDLQEDWIKVDIKDDNEIGYIKREYAELIVDFTDAVSKEEEQELLRLQEEERIKEETEVKYRDELNYAEKDLKLLACLVYAEAGDQSYEGKLAVANIVLNRVKSYKYPDTLKDVIYQPGQFTVAASGSLAKQLNNYDNYSSNSQRLTIKAARAALEGANNIGNRLYFHSYQSAVNKGYDHKSDCVKVDDQLFW